MAIFQVRFHRYDPRSSDARISGVQHINAENFHDAVLAADYMIAGMRGANPECKFEICHVLSYDYRGADCEGGIHMWETAAEMTDRITSGDAAL
jgi:hypothetical protein